MKLYGWARANGVAVRALFRWRERVAIIDAQAARGAQSRRAMREEEARQLLAEWEDVGGPLAVFCRGKGVSSDALYRWRDRLAATAGTAEAPRLVEVTAVGAAEPAARYDVVIGRFRVVVGDDFAEATLARLLRVVASC